MKTKEEFFKMEVSEVSQAYVGKNRVCRCGCKGTYTATSFMEDPRSTVDDDKVKSILTRAKNMVKNGEAKFDCEGNYINVSYGNNNAITFYTDELKNCIKTL